MTRNIRRNKSIQTTIKDYIVPIIAGIIILIIIYSFFKSDGTTPVAIDSENKTPTEISFGSPSTEAIIKYPGDSQEIINESNSLYKGETIIIKEGTLSLTNPEGSKINLNKIAELKYNEDGSYSFYSSDAWFTLAVDTSISMRYANITAPAKSVLSLTQNEAGSTVYVLAGSAKISNLSGISTSLVKGQKISVSRLNAASKDVDLSAEKGNIDSYFKGSDWFIENNGHIVLQQSDGTENTDETSGSGSLSGSGTIDENNTDTNSALISFNTLRDEMSIDTNTITISGNIKSENISAITINNQQTALNTTNKTFSLEKLTLSGNINDIVVKIYDSSKNILEKRVYTVYTSAKSSTSTAIPTTSDTVVSQSTQSSTTYNIDATKFSFTEPSTTNQFVTTSGEITIRGKTTAEGIKEVQVNGFTLGSFNGSTWRYHAFERFETLEEGTNQYRVDYFGENGKVVYTDYYTIVKRSSTASTSTAAPSTVTTEEKIPQEDDLFSQ